MLPVDSDPSSRNKFRNTAPSPARQREPVLPAANRQFEQRGPYPYNLLMPNSLPLLKPREVAAMLGISYPTVKQWILAGKLRTVQTPGGHHRIEQAALKPFLKQDTTRPALQSRERFRRVSGRNQLIGSVLDVQIDGLLAKVVISFGEQQITAIVTADAVREMDLKKGDQAAALIKATEVMVERI